MPTTVWGNYIWAVAPTILVGLLFWFAMRAIIRSDRTERKVSARIEAEERAKLAAAKAESPTPTSVE
jgi:flagellar biosynthesis/type III secretory pathway M-ring protein FliF/YscJ